jgi:hypothetical protein
MLRDILPALPGIERAESPARSFRLYHAPPGLDEVVSAGPFIGPIESCSKAGLHHPHLPRDRNSAPPPTADGGVRVRAALDGGKVVLVRGN